MLLLIDCINVLDPSEPSDTQKTSFIDEKRYDLGKFELQLIRFGINIIKTFFIHNRKVMYTEPCLGDRERRRHRP